jgi:DNA polymerase-3 subunit gamma/tau
MEMLTIPASQWEKLKTVYIRKQRGETENDEKNEEDPLIAEAKKLFGDELIEIKK